MADVGKLESTSSTIQDSTDESSNNRPISGDWNKHVRNYATPSKSPEDQIAKGGVLEIPPLSHLSKVTRHEALAKVADIPNWRELKSKTPLWPCDASPAVLYEFHTGNGSRVNLVVADLKSGSWQLHPAINEKLHPTSEKAEKDKVTAAINGGYFAPNGQSVSHVVIDGKVVANPSTYKGFPEKYRSQILNRAELRVLINEAGITEVDITPHNAPIPEGYKILHSLQAGPNLLKEGVFDEAALRREAFIRKDDKGNDLYVIRSSTPAARTAIGITEDGHALMVSVADKSHDKRSPGVTIKQLALLMDALGCTKALNLDGGASTTMFARTSKEGVCEITMKPGKPVNSKNPETWVKSILELRHVGEH
jgi:hypothetical protein